ncbi:MAG TPA: cysteine desulfurase family protein [Clostridia bacterium]
MIYLDNAATTKMYSEVLDIYKEFGCDNFFNPSALYKQSLDVAIKIRQAKATLAQFFGGNSDEIIFTASATEANNMALRGAIKTNAGIVISAGEHPSIYNTAMSLKNSGISCEVIPLLKNGQIDQEKLYNYLTQNKVSVVSVIHASNETGAINDIKQIAKNVKKISPTTLFHSDGVQAFGKISVKNLGVDLYSFSAHKIKGPKGIGSLYIKKGVKLNPIITGGGQENNLRSGTENVANILAFAKSATLFSEQYNLDQMLEFKKAFIDIITSKIDDIIFTLANDYSTMPHIISMIIPNVKGETLLHMLESKDILIGLGSACSSNSRGNRVLQALGYSPKMTESSVRISFSPDNTIDEVKYAANTFVECVTQYRKSNNR